MEMIIIIVAILGLQLIINIIAVIWLNRAFMEFCNKVYTWIDQAAAKIAEKLRDQNYGYLQENESKFSRLVNMVEEKMKNPNRDNQSENLKNHFVSFDVFPINPFEDACVQMITAKGTHSILPTVYLDFGDNFAWNDHYNEKTMIAVEKFLIQAFEEFDMDCMPDKVGRPVAFLYQVARHTTPSFAVEFGAKVLYRRPNSTDIVIETIHAIIESVKTRAIFNGPRIALFGSDIVKASVIEQGRMARAIAVELRASDAESSYYKNIHPRSIER